MTSLNRSQAGGEEPLPQPAGGLQNPAPCTCRRGYTLWTVTPGCGTDSPRACEKAEAPEGTASGQYCSRNPPAEGGSSQPRRYCPPGPPGSVWTRCWLSQLGGACQGSYQHPTVRRMAPQQRLIWSKTPRVARLRKPGFDESTIISISEHRFWGKAGLQAQGNSAQVVSGSVSVGKS